MLALTNYDYVVFDCDGVVLDSNKIKSDVFRSVLKRYPSREVEEFIDYHERHGGISRQEKLLHFFTKILGQETPLDYADVLEDFGQQCTIALAKSGLVPGVFKYLERIYALDLPMFIVSGGSEKEIKAVFKEKNIDHFFNAICGNPAPKRDGLKGLIESGRAQGLGAYFGDAKLDYQLAQEFGLDFCFVAGFSEWEDGLRFCERRNIVCVTDFNELLTE